MGDCACQRWPTPSTLGSCRSVKGKGGTLEEDIESIQRDAAFHDVVFVCGEEEEEIGACRALAAARSPVLRSMLLTSGMVESSATRVYFPDIEPECMHICLEFFYTDSVQNSSWSSILLAMKVVKAAMFFLLGRLESVALQYIFDTCYKYAENGDGDYTEWCEGLIPSFTLATQLYPAHISKDQRINPSWLCNLKGFLNIFRGLAKQNVAGCNDELLFSGCKHERLFYKSISEQSLALFIEGLDDTKPLSHYFSFLHVVRWSASRVVMAHPSINEAELEDALNKCFPRSSQLMGSMLSSCTDIEYHDDANVSRFMKLLADPLAQCLQKIPFNLAKIPTHVLCRFMEPLDIFPSSILLKAYRHQALDRPDLHWEQPCDSGSSYQVNARDPTVICSKGQGFKSFAMCSIHLNATSNAFLDWEIVILKPCKATYIGFCVRKPTLRASDRRALQVLGVEPGTWALRADGSLHHTDLSSESGSSDYVDAFHDNKVSIQVHLNLANRSCSFSIDGKDAGLAWNNLPLFDHTTIHPAISLGRKGMAKIQMVHQGWMDGPSKRLRIANN